MVISMSGEAANGGFRKFESGFPYPVRLALVNFSASVLIGSLLAFATGDFSLQRLGHYLLFALVYSYSIGTLTGGVMHYFWPRLLATRFPANWLLVGLVLIGTTTAGCLIGVLVLDVLGQVPQGEYWIEFYHAYRISIVLTLVIGVSIILYEVLRQRLADATLQLRTKELEEERARKLAAQAQLSSLESRIHPHFLFNTLNSISSLIPEDPQLAEHTVGRLATLLRYSLDANQHSLVPLRQELNVAREYLEIEKARFGPRLRYSIDVPEQLAECAVPPLALQTVVENSVKHAIAARREGGEVRVAARSEAGSLEIDVTDDGPGFDLERIPPGHGLHNLIGRLDALFGDEARLGTVTRDGRPSVRLSIPSRSL